MSKISKKRTNIKTKYGSFTCIFENESDMGGYTAEVPSLQGAVSWGKNLAQAKKMIREAIEGIVEAQAIILAEETGTIRITKKPIINFA